MLGSGSKLRQRREYLFAIHGPRHFSNATRLQNSRRDAGATKGRALHPSPRARFPISNIPSRCHERYPPYFRSLSYCVGVV
jgi:hypothetical protein